MPNTVENSEPDFQPTMDVQAHPDTAEAQAHPTCNLPDNTKVTEPGGAAPAAVAKTLGTVPKGLGDYEIIGEIARGGMGVVFKARQKSLDRVVALKMILSDSIGNEISIKRFKQEAQSAAALDHPGIVPIYEISECEGKHFYTMAFVEGSSLTAMVRKKRLSASEAVDLILPVVEAVAFAHAHKIIHRNLKPDNILIDAQGRPRVTDFGLAKRTQSDSGLTMNGQILGTPSYMAPEQALGGQRTIGPEVDIYALGAIVHYMLIGAAPFTGGSVTEILCKVVHNPPTLPRQLNPDVPEALNDVVARCLQKEPGDRYKTAAALADALRATKQTVEPARERSIGETVDATAKHQAVTPRRRPSVLLRALAAATLIAITAGAAYLWNRERNQPDQPPAPGGLVAVEPPKQKLFFPEETQNDFGLTVKLLGGTVDEKGIHRFKTGDQMRLSIDVDQKCYVGVWWMEPDGSVNQLFPIEDGADFAFTPGQPRIIPEGKIKLEATPSTGTEHIRVVASSVKWNPAKGTRNAGNPFMVFQGREDLDKVVTAVQSVSRGVAVRAKIAEASIPFFVTKQK